jgi:coiled-coil domain-containing protein 55
VQVADLHAAALAQDASVFDYDGVYESIQEQRVKPKQQEKLARKSRYIEGLLDKAKERQREQDIIYERTCAAIYMQILYSPAGILSMH